MLPAYKDLLSKWAKAAAYGRVPKCDGQTPSLRRMTTSIRQIRKPATLRTLHYAVDDRRYRAHRVAIRHVARRKRPTREWRRTPKGGELEIKGAILARDATEYLSEGKRDRSWQLHRLDLLSAETDPGVSKSVAAIQKVTK